MGSQVFASGIPTVDVSAITQAVLQLQQLQQASYQTQLQQYNTAVNQLKNFTGNRGFGTLKYDLNLRNLIPQDVQSRLNSILSGTGTLSNLGKQFFEKFELGRACEQLEGEPKEYCLRSQNYKAETAAALQQGQNTVAQRLQNIESLMSKINEAEDAKAIADLSASNSSRTSSFKRFAVCGAVSAGPDGATIQSSGRSCKEKKLFKRCSLRLLRRI